jgi:RNA polymerase sigma-70 factor (ECF subfamily)
MLKQTKPISDERAQWLATHIIPHEVALRARLKGKTSLGCDVDDIVQETYAILATKRTVDAINNPKTYAFRRRCGRPSDT